MTADAREFNICVLMSLVIRYIDPLPLLVGSYLTHLL